MFSTNGTNVLSFQNIYKLYTSVLKNHHIYSINTYICPGYSCEILVEISLYFDLQEINKFIATYRGRYLSEIYLFCVAQNSTYFLQNFYRTFGICIYMWVFNFNLKKKIRSSGVRVCQIHFLQIIHLQLTYKFGAFSMVS
jgi:hypothetical protein